MVEALVIGAFTTVQRIYRLIKHFFNSIRLVILIFSRIRILARLAWGFHNKVIGIAHAASPGCASTTAFMHIWCSLLPFSGFDVFAEMLVLNVCHGWARFLISTGLRYDEGARFGQNVAYTFNVGVADSLRQLVYPVAQGITRDLFRITLPVVLKSLGTIF